MNVIAEDLENGLSHRTVPKDMPLAGQGPGFVSSFLGGALIIHELRATGQGSVVTSSTTCYHKCLASKPRLV